MLFVTSVWCHSDPKHLPVPMKFCYNEKLLKPRCYVAGVKSTNRRTATKTIFTFSWSSLQKCFPVSWFSYRGADFHRSLVRESSSPSLSLSLVQNFFWSSSWTAWRVIISPQSGNFLTLWVQIQGCQSYNHQDDPGLPGRSGNIILWVTGTFREVF